MLGPKDDRQLVEKALSGSERAWRGLVKRYEKRLYNHALRITGNPDDAMDVLQDVMMSVYRNLSGYRGDGSFAAWLFQIATFRCMDFLRRRRVRQHETPSHTEIPDSDDNPQETHLGNVENNKDILRLMATLSAEQRQVVELRFFQHFTFEEIATQLGISSSTAKSRLYSALEKMRKHSPAVMAV